MLSVSAAVCAALLCCNNALSCCICIMASLLWSLPAALYKGRALYYLPAAAAAVLTLYSLFLSVGPLPAVLIFAAGIYMSQKNKYAFAPPLLFILSLAAVAASAAFGAYSPVAVTSDLPGQLLAITAPACVMRGRDTAHCFAGTLLAVPVAAFLMLFYCGDAYLSAISLLTPALIACQAVIFTRQAE